MIEKIVKYFLIMFIFVIYACSGFIIFEYFSFNKNVYTFAFDFKAKPSCTSDSMGLSLDCRDIVYGTKINNQTKLYPGYIYIYQSLNSSNDSINIVHRLVYCLDEDCNLTVFKGDNNRVAELVNRSDILYIVDTVEYR